MFPLISLLTLSLLFPVPQDMNSGDDIIKSMHSRYRNTWYNTLTFTQKTITYSPDGGKHEATWYEYMSIPGRLRIDIAPVDSGNSMLFANDSLFVFQRGALRNARPLVHSLLVLGFDLYHVTPEETAKRLRALHYDLSVVDEDIWQNRPVYIVGAKKGNTKTNQFWVDKERLVFVRSLGPSQRDTSIVVEVQFNDYHPLGKAWISPTVLFLQNGKVMTEEYYSDVKIGVTIDEKMFEVK